jgi:hypothetical protein
MKGFVKLILLKEREQASKTMVLQEQKQGHVQAAREVTKTLNACQQLVSWFCDFAPGTPKVVLKQKEEGVPSHCGDYKTFAEDSIHGSSAFVRDGSLAKCEAELKATLEMNTLFE